MIKEATDIVKKNNMTLNVFLIFSVAMIANVTEDVNEMKKDF